MFILREAQHKLGWQDEMERAKRTAEENKRLQEEKKLAEQQVIITL